MEFLLKYVETSFLRHIFLISLKIIKHCFSSFYISSKFLPSFLKIIAKFFCIPKFHQKHRSANFCIPMFLHSFFKLSSQLIKVWSYTIMSANTIQNWKFSQNFSKTFRQPYELFSKCFSNFLKMFEKIPSGANDRINLKVIYF